MKSFGINKTFFARMLFGMFIIGLFAACTKDNIKLPAITPPYGDRPLQDTPLPDEFTYDQLYWKIDTNTQQLITWQDIPAEYSNKTVTVVTGVGNEIILISKYNGSSSQSLYYKKLFNQIGVFKRYSGNVPKMNKNGNWIDYAVQSAFFIRDNGGFNSITVTFK
jgi:hypothetical protein